MPPPADLDQLDAQTLRRMLIEQERELVWRQTKIERLRHELALNKHTQSPLTATTRSGPAPGFLRTQLRTSQCVIGGAIGAPAGGTQRGNPRAKAHI